MFGFRFEDPTAGRFHHEIGCTNGRALFDPMGAHETLYLCIYERGRGPLESRRIHVTMRSAIVNGLADQELILEHRKTWTRRTPEEVAGLCCRTLRR